MVTGNLGYIGSVLVPVLNKMLYKVVGYDTGYYGKECLLYNESCDDSNFLEKQIKKDIRDVSIEDLKGVDGIIHLAALSNDPLGELEPEITEEINLDATLKLARLTREAGVKRFIYASSQSMYGISNLSSELDEDDSDKHPITAYAKTKWTAECELKKLNDEKFIVSCFRPSTVFGLSPKLRTDIVFNNLVSSAFTTGYIEIKSDGTPWRPVVHVQDVSKAFIAGLIAPPELVSGKSFNVGIPNGNFTVRELAEAAQEVVADSKLCFTGEHGNDSRTYKVSFERILTSLQNYFKPEWGLIQGGKELVDSFEKVHFSEEDFRSHRFNRLSRLKKLMNDGKLDKKLRWIE
ncbi:MAG: NAD(P)-dependent oxidoreductase [Desulfamplus sp.]|nr:NAD(P)-dependent oxidoreductase [Desulfamplus sp.]